MPRIGPAQGMRAESGTLGKIEDEIVGRVVGGGDLLEDDMALALQLLGVDKRNSVRISARISSASGQSFLRTRA